MVELDPDDQPIIARRLRSPVTAVSSLSAVTEPRRFFLRTFGCQMNEHDSERIAGLLQADGLVETDRAEDADVVVLNTCCIRENADNKLYGTLGPPQVREGPQARDADHGRRAAWPRRTARRSPTGRPTSTSCSAPTTCTGPPTCSTRRGTPATRSSRSSRRRWPRTTTPSRPPCRCAARCRGRAGSRSRSAATTAAPSASCPPCGARRSAAASTTSSTRCAGRRPTASPRSRCSART